MHPVPFAELVNRIIGEYRLHQSIFGIPQAQFFKDDEKHHITIFGRQAHTALGPAAGPHTQLAQNIITSYLVGGRFIELKTVQQKDDFALTGAVGKPCIDCTDEGYNVEWSSEYTLPKAWDEYCKAYIILCLLDALSSNGKFEEPSFIFNMSVGYTLDGIKTPKMQKFIDSMIDAKKDPRFSQYLADLDALLLDNIFEGTSWEGKEKKLSGLTAKIDGHICNNVTISTMHGCPPKEIEAICSYMLTQKRLHTYVKLNPTLLGYDAVRKILDTNGFAYISLKRESFEKDLQFNDALSMLHRLFDLGKSLHLEFGVKLTNTLGSINNLGRLPGEEMYMSGRALLPISVTVAAKLSEAFGGGLPISYCGGVSSFTVEELFEAGIRPLTLATDMLHPGGYAKLLQMAKQLGKSKAWDKTGVDSKALALLSEKACSGKFRPVIKASRSKEQLKIGRDLPLTDCYIAPCQVACPIHQPIPEYVQLVGEGRYSDALALIYNTNPLPGITGYICDHQCQEQCTRNEYEGAVQIREMKRIALEKGFADYKKEWEGPTEKSTIKAAIIGAGPAGLAAAFFLARSGFDTTVFEREKDAGGVVRHVIPGFRIPQKIVEDDISFIKAHGVRFVFSAKKEQLGIASLKEEGYSYIFYAIGSEKDNDIGISGDGVTTSLSFLNSYRKDPSGVRLGGSVVVVGGGNTAMDSARAAKRLSGVTSVTIVYRRSEEEMPADHEEFEACLSEGIKCIFLANPIRLEEKKLLLSKMRLGEKDASGRRMATATEKTISIPCDSLITAIGEKADTVALKQFGLPVTSKGWPEVDKETMRTGLEGVYVIGDAQSGPSTVVSCIASAQKAVDDAIEHVLGPDDEHEHEHGHCDCEDPHHGDDDECDEDEEEEDLSAEELEQLTADENAYFAELYQKKTIMRESKSFSCTDFAANEAKRCMECSYLCNKCVDVCPNRANVAVDVRNCAVFDNPFQIVHIDAYCNECGNCETFCPYSGGPYKKKFTIFSSQDDFEKSENDGFFGEGEDVTIRQGGKVYQAAFDSEGNLGGEEGVTDEVAALIEEIYTSYSYLLGPVED